MRRSPFLDMTDLYHTPGTADACIASLAYHPEAQALFAAEIAYSRGQIDQVYKQARHFLDRRSGMYAVPSGGLLLSLVAMCWMNLKGIIIGKPGKILDPKGGATRAEAATMFHRYCDITER